MAFHPQQHTLSSLLHGIASVPSVFDCRIYGIALDSRKIKKGDCFFALSGRQTDAHHFIADAKERGAVAVLVESDEEALFIYHYL